MPARLLWPLTRPVTRYAAALLLAVLLLVGPASVTAAEAVAPPTVLAAETVGEGEPLPGPEPDFGSENTFQPAEYETPWTWWMGVLLTAVAVLAIGGVALGYWLLVPKRREQARR